MFFILLPKGMIQAPMVSIRRKNPHVTIACVLSVPRVMDGGSEKALIDALVKDASKHDRSSVLSFSWLCVVWMHSVIILLCWCFTALRHILGHCGSGQLT